MLASPEKSIRKFIETCEYDAQEMNDLALRLFHWQVRHNPDYAAITAGRRPGGIEEVPAVPTGLFRDLTLTCFPPERAAQVFRTSGTTTGRPGIHRMLNSAIYDLSATTWYRRCLPRAPGRHLSLIPSASSSPGSSLSHMVACLAPCATHAVSSHGRPDASLAWNYLRQVREPVTIFATALGLHHLLSHSPAGGLVLPTGSLLMITGGFKGRSLDLEPQELISRAFGLLGDGIRWVGEYGMTELSSQLWSRPLTLQEYGEQPTESEIYRIPPWLHVMATDPGTGAPLPPGHEGQLRFIDLANLHSVLAIETSDLGTLLDQHRLHLRGRLPGARCRGCSLDVEEALGH